MRLRRYGYGAPPKPGTGTIGTRFIVPVSMVEPEQRPSQLPAGRTFAPSPANDAAKADAEKRAELDRLARAWEAEIAAENAAKAAAQQEEPAAAQEEPVAHSQPTDAEWVEEPVPSGIPWGKLAIGAAILKALAFI